MINLQLRKCDADISGEVEWNFMLPSHGVCTGMLQ